MYKIFLVILIEVTTSKIDKTLVREKKKKLELLNGLIIIVLEELIIDLDS